MKRSIQQFIQRYLFAVVMGILTLAIILIPHRSYSKEAPAKSTQAMPSKGSDSPCFYSKPDGTVVDLRAICGDSSVQAPQPARSTGSSTSSPNQPAAKLEVNPAMKITRPNDSGVLYVSGSGGIDRGAQSASQHEKTGR